MMGLRSALLLLWMALSVPALAAGPELAAPEMEFDFGEIVQGTKVSHTFVFQNSGAADLVIERVRSSCGCTAALLSSKRLPPGAEGELQAVFDSGRFRGAVSKNITLHTNVPQAPRTVFVVRAFVRPEVDLSPEAVDVGALAPLERREVQVTVTNRGERTIVLGAPRATHPEISVRMEQGSLAPGESRKLTVGVVPSEETSGVNGYVLLRAEGAAVPELRLSVYGRVSR